MSETEKAKRIDLHFARKLWEQASTSKLYLEHCRANGDESRSSKMLISSGVLSSISFDEKEI